MKSNLFSRFDVVKYDKFKNDFESINKFNELQLIKIIENLPLYLENTFREDDEILISNLAKEFSATFFDIDNSFYLFKFFVKRIIQKEYISDQPNDIASDLVELKLIQDNRRQEFERIFKKLKKILLIEKNNLQAQRYKSGILPKLKNFNATIEIRPVFERVELPKESHYKPKILGAVPIASIHIGLNSDINNDLYFQIDEDDVQYLISSLENIDKEMKQAKKDFNLK